MISIVFIFLSCHKRANDNKEFSRENLIPFSESRIMTHLIKPCFFKPELFSKAKPS